MSNILYLAEHRNGKFRKPVLELTSYSRAIADMTGGKLTALVPGDVPGDEIKVLGTYGAEQVLHASGDQFQHLDNGIWSEALAQAVEKSASSIVVFGDSLAGKALAPVLAVKINAGFAAGVVALPESVSPFMVKRKVFTGKAFASVELTTGNKVLTLSSNSYEIKESPRELAIEDWTPENLPEPAAEVLETDTAEGKVLLTEAEIVVSAGRGMRGPENWQPVEELAEVLGAATACSRPVSDEGWRPHAEHVGQTGKIIAPNLYFAFGISGAVQHVAGISSSKVIVAVNKDPEAPIFGVADYGIVGDVHKVIPDLVESAKKFKENS